MKKFLTLAIVLALSLTLFAGCSKPAVYKDGTFVAVSDATDKGYMLAEVTVKKDKIEAVKLVGLDSLGLEKTEKYPYETYHQAVVDLAKEMVDKNTWDVAAVTKASSTSTQSKQAAERAMEKALVKPASTAKYFDGTFMAISDQTEKGWTVAWVTIEDDKITDVVFHSTTKTTDDEGNTKFVRKDETYPHAPYHEAREVLPERIVEKNGTDIEAVTGATGTTETVKQAVERALEQASR